MRTKSFLKISTLALILGISLYSQEKPKQEDSALLSDLLELLNTPVTTSSKRAEKTIEAASVMSVVSRDQFQSYGWTSINDALYSLPGFGPSQDYDRKTVSSRGLFEGWNNNHILLLVDGIPFNDNVYGSAYTWEITPVFFTKTLEVVRGPGSALYGSNATNSVSHIKTLSVKDLRHNVEAQMRLGSNGERLLDVVTGQESGLISAVVAFSTNKFGGSDYQSHDGSGRLDSTGNLAKFPINDGRNSQYLWAKLEGEGALKGWQFQYHKQDWNYKTGHGWVWLAPDQGEHLQEGREIVALSYNGKISTNWSQEYMVRYQRHDINWNIRFVPKDVWGYSDGMSEYLDTSASDLFGRAQWSWDLPSNANFLFGFEGTRFSYKGDSSHYGVNIDFSDYSMATGSVPAGPWLEFIKDKPVMNTGYYAQFSSGNLLGKHFKAVLGIRADKTSFDYVKIYDAGKPTSSKSYSNTSPRVAFVWMPTDKLAVKLMTGKAFRAPAPSELAGANTYTLASNIEELKPETLTTSELAVDWIISNNFNWRTNIFRTEFSDQIAYSVTNFNLSTNLYTLTTQGLETELLFGYGAWRGYTNYSYATRVNEEINPVETSIALSKDKLTWEPSSRFKLGVIYNGEIFTGSMNLMYQGRVERRSTDIIPETSAHRPVSLDPWLQVNAKVGFRINHQFRIDVVGTNVLGTDKNRLVKNMAYPFDYQGEGRKVAIILKASF